MATVLKEKKGSPPRSVLKHTRGTTFTKTYRFQDKNGNPRDISNSTFQFQVRVSKYDNDQTPLIDATDLIKGQSQAAIDAGIAKDELLVKISDDDADVVAGKWQFGFVETDGSGDRNVRHTGPFILREDIARK